MRHAPLLLAMMLLGCGAIRARLEAAADAAFRAGVGVLVAESTDPKARAGRRRWRLALLRRPSCPARLSLEVSRCW
jgi:hypothetical protein